MADFKGFVNILNHEHPFKAVYTTYGTKNLEFRGKSLVVMNDGVADIKVTVNDLVFLVRGGSFYETITGECVELDTGEFKSFRLDGTTAFRCWVRGL